MHQYRHFFAVDVNSGMLVARMPRPVMTGDKNADVFLVHLQDGGKMVSLDGAAVTGKVIRADGQTVPLAGSVAEGVAKITLDESCYAVPGEIKLTVTVSAGDVVQSVLIVTMDVQTSETGIVVDNGVIGTLSELLAEIAAMRQVTAEARAAIEKIDKALDFGAQHAGELLVIGADGKPIPLAIGDGLEIVDGVLRVKATGEAVEGDVFYTADGEIFYTLDGAVFHVREEM